MSAGATPVPRRATPGHRLAPYAARPAPRGGWLVRGAGRLASSGRTPGASRPAPSGCRLAPARIGPGGVRPGTVIAAVPGGVTPAVLPVGRAVADRTGVVVVRRAPAARPREARRRNARPTSTPGYPATGSPASPGGTPGGRRRRPAVERRGGRRRWSAVGRRHGRWPAVGGGAAGGGRGGRRAAPAAPVRGLVHAGRPRLPTRDRALVRAVAAGPAGAERTGRPHGPANGSCGPLKRPWSSVAGRGAMRAAGAAERRTRAASGRPW